MGGCQLQEVKPGAGGDRGVKWVKVVKRYKLAVIKYISPGMSCTAW